MQRGYKHIKSLFPNNLKYPLWYVFKSPQRKLGWHTLARDLGGMAVYLWRKLFPKQQPEPVSICTGLYNRSDMYVDALLASVTKAAQPELIELSVFDCGSTDVPALEASIRRHWKGKLVFHTEPVPFTRAHSFNRAVAQCTSPLVFICDADMSIPSNIVQLCNAYTSKHRVWYPIVYTLFKDKPARVGKGNGFWMKHAGKGMLACRKASFMQIGMLDEKFTTWGAEDDELWERFVKAGFTVIRNFQHGLIHHWHASFNPNART